MKHIDVTSQQTRHQMLMDLAAVVTKHRDENPDESAQETAEVEQRPSVHTYHSSK